MSISPEVLGILPLLRENRKLLPVNGHSAHVSHTERDQLVRADQYLTEAGVPEETLARYFDENGHWNYEEPYLNVTDMSPEEALVALEPIVSPILQMSMSSLYHGHQYAIDGLDSTLGLFSLHEWDHVSRVADRAVSLSRMSGVSDMQVLTDTAVAGALHDSMNGLGRAYHHLTGARIVRKFPNLTGGDRLRLRNIASAIFFHNEPIYKGGPFNLVGVPFQEKVERMSSWLSGSALALLASDKVDETRRRVPRHARNPQVVEAHKYTSENLFTEFDGFELRTDGTITVNYLHTPMIHCNEEGFEALAVDKNQEWSMIIPPLRLQDTYGRLSMESVHNELWRINGPQRSMDASRYDLTFTALAALFPQSEYFEMNYVHALDPDQRIQVRFDRKNADKILQETAEKSTYS